MAIAQTINGWLRKIPTWPLYVIAPIPGFVYFYWAVMNQLGPDPLQTLERQLGLWALQMLIVTLLVTPIRTWTNINLVKFRRAFGLTAFMYVCSHLLTWFVLDKQFYWDEILKDLYKRPYIIVGMVAFLILLPLAITSNNKIIRKMGPVRWRKLHKLSYVAALAGSAHYLLVVKAWPPEPILYLMGVIALLLVRVNWGRLRKAAA